MCGLESGVLLFLCAGCGGNAGTLARPQSPWRGRHGDDVLDGRRKGGALFEMASGEQQWLIAVPVAAVTRAGVKWEDA